MKFLCGDDCGTIKLVNISKSNIGVEDQWGEIQSRHSITRLDWANRGSDNKTEFFSLHATGTINFQYITGHERFEIKNRRDDIINAYSFHPQTDNNRVVLYITKSGKLVTTNVNLENIMTEERKYESRTSDLINGSRVLEGTDLSYNHRELAFGGREEVVKVWDVERNSLIWSSENIPPDNYGIPNPIWESDVCFGDRSHGTNFVATCTKHHELRLYDRRVGQREIYRNSWGEHAFTKIISSPHNPYEYISGNTIGRICRWNQKRIEDNVKFRNLKFSGVHVYKASVGSIRDVSFVGSNHQFLCSVGVDRYLRVFDYQTRIQKWMVFLWKKQNSVLVIDHSCDFEDESQEKSERSQRKKKKKKEKKRKRNQEEEGEEREDLESLQSTFKKRKLD